MTMTKKEEIKMASVKSAMLDSYLYEYVPSQVEAVPTSGTKHDAGKPDLSLLPRAALEEMAKAFMYGEQKYGRHNFKAGFKSHRLIAAAMRHILAWNEGEDLDPESGHSHLGHALATLAMILECDRLKTLEDTRYKKG
jgi:hypothetical protein